jgi:hypothetical protein
VEKERKDKQKQAGKEGVIINGRGWIPIVAPGDFVPGADFIFVLMSGGWMSRIGMNICCW